MTSPTDLLLDAFGRAHDLVPAAIEELTVDELLWRPDPDANPIAWLVWHLTRVQDDHLAELGGVEQRYTADGWADRFGLPYPTDALGYGQSSEEVGAFRLTDPSLLTGYHESVHAMTVDVVRDLDDLDRVVDERWDPPVTAAVRLVSVVNDITQHVGQAAYVRGLALRRR
ncbi:mycothiol transferase [Nocardioides caldifontis]|uniref:mycothiol transferase n=1 Tax=Nocardioides caldifontis TaxID=2588938 RepID=UPI0011DF936D|nr:DinB family protein [Nocardioides caldifontis]